MQKQTFHFPPGFFWGAATSAHQVEGGNTNDWSEWEKANAQKLARKAHCKFQFLSDSLLKQAQNPENYISGKASNQFELYEEDFDLMQKLNMNAYRFSLEWSRIEPEEGKFDENALAHYATVITALRQRNIEPFVSLWHWPLPLWLRDKGGWENAQIVFYFQKYTQKVLETLSAHVTYWITLNEPEIYAINSYKKGEWPPQKKNYFAFLKVRKNLIKAHQESFKLIKKIDQKALVGMANNIVDFAPEGNFFWNKFLAAIANFFWNGQFLRPCKKYIDFIGLNFYFHNRVCGWFQRNKNEKLSDLGWELYPQSVQAVLESLKKYQKPIIITENGLADAEDRCRAWYIREVVRGMAKALQNGVDLRGYLHWSLLDNFEWDKGFWPRFGLIAVDYENGCKRMVRESAHEYAEIIRENGIEMQN